MTRVVERCPNCGVEHDDAQGGECEVCGTPLRYWCTVHGAQVGWLDEPTCPRCEAEPEERVIPRPSTFPGEPGPLLGRERVEHPLPVGRRGGVRRDVPHWRGGEPGRVARRGMEDIGPYVISGAGVALRLMRALLAVVRSVIGWGLLGGIVGGGIAISQGRDLVWTALFGIMIGGGVGLFFGAIAALRILFSRPPPGH